MFEEAGFEIYEHREMIELPEPFETRVQREARHRRQALDEILERVRDRYFREEDGGNVDRAALFIARLMATVEPILDAE